MDPNVDEILQNMWPPRARTAIRQCEDLLLVLNCHAQSGYRALATNALENAAAHLELLTDDPRFKRSLVPGVVVPPPLYNEQVIRRQRKASSKAPRSSVPEIETPTPEQLQALYDLPSPPDPPDV